jgi:hypothetical protein
VLCDLISAQAAVLERNVSTDMILRHKRSNLQIVGSMNEIISQHLLELSETDAYTVAAYAVADQRFVAAQSPERSCHAGM